MIERAADITLRRDLTDQVLAELVRHSVAEEQYLYRLCESTFRTAICSLTRSFKSLERLDADHSEFMPRSTR